MTDLDELFASLIDESAARRAPVEEMETRARDYRRRERRRHRAQGFLAGAVVIAVVVGAVAFVRSGGDETVTPPAQSTPTTTIPSVHVPAGWHTYDYGLARLSIPPDWTATEGCPRPRTLAMQDLSPDDVSCMWIPGPGIAIAPYTPPSDPYRPDREANGIPYEMTIPRCLSAHCSSTARVKALGVSISFTGGVDANAVLKTLTYSTYARVQQQPFGPTPATWKTVSSGGIAVSVPASWAVADLRTTGFCSPAPNTAYFGPLTIIPGCASSFDVAPPSDSVQLSPGSETGEGTTLTRHGLRLVRAPLAAPVAHELTFTVRGGRHPVTVTVGLGLDPAIARGILGSIRLAK